MSILKQLERRGLVYDTTHREELEAMLSRERVVFYTGFDPTAPSLHVGNLVPVVLMSHLQEAGHKPLVLVGGATGMIGDPSGKSEERQLLDAATLEANVEVFKAQLSRFLRFGDGPSDAVIVNNADWFEGIGYLEFLRDIGKHLTINYMMAKDSVRARLEDRDHGISYTEFSYMLLQAYDFVHLSREHGCRLQVGGSDQWGNITAGTELQRKLGGPQLYALVAPLLLDASGQKMGKTAAGTKLWLDPERTSPYAFYQYWLNVDDADVVRLLRLFSRRPLEELDALAAEHEDKPQQRRGHRALAEELTAWIHGEDAARRVVAASQVMFGGDLDDLKDDDLRPLLDEVPSSSVPRDELAAGIPLIDLLARTGLAKSKGAARRLLAGGGVYLNNRRIDEDRPVTTSELATQTMLVLRAGKKSYHIVQVA
jgi:tyrosyl-tRNA synthetase